MKAMASVIVLALLLPACNDEGGAPAAPSSPVPTPPPRTTGPAPPTAPVSSNQPPVLGIKIRPDTPSGPVPRDVNVNMCPSTDPEGDRLIFEYKWGGTGGTHFSFQCRDDHTYTVPGSYRAFFCVNDDHDHRVCANVRIDITP